VNSQTKEFWLELCERAADEQDPERFRAIIREINFVLEFKNWTLRAVDHPVRIKRIRYGLLLSVPPASAA
jgi:hypothetical protein